MKQLLVYIRTINVIDNMLKMLQAHAENLEGLVAERTAELGDEKKKVEDSKNRDKERKAREAEQQVHRDQVRVKHK